MKWIIDKTYYFCKYNTLKLNKRILENSYIKELKAINKQVEELGWNK